MPADQSSVVANTDPPLSDADLIVDSQSNATQPDEDPARSRFDTFTHFPKLPIELRLIIWKFALPNGANDDGNRVFCFHAHITHSLTLQCSEVTFRVTPRMIPTPPSLTPETLRIQADLKAEDQLDRKDMRNVALLRACKESRDVFLNRFQRILPAEGMGVIRFEDQTSIHIRNNGDALKKDILFALQRQHNPLPSFDTVQRLAFVHNRDHQNILFCLFLFSDLRHVKICHGSPTNVDLPNLLGLTMWHKQILQNSGSRSMI